MDCQATAAPPERAATQAWPVRRITAALWAATLLAALAVLALTLIIWGDLKLSDGISSLYVPVAAAGYATFGVLIIRRAASLLGWIMLAEGIGLAFLQLASGYAIAGVAAHPGSLPAAKLAGTLSKCIFSPRGLPHRLHVPAFPDREADAAGDAAAPAAGAGAIITSAAATASAVAVLREGMVLIGGIFMTALLQLECHADSAAVCWGGSQWSVLSAAKWCGCVWLRWPAARGRAAYFKLGPGSRFLSVRRWPGFPCSCLRPGSRGRAAWCRSWCPT
jgi:hypothetical protein